jgi:hypothetical protein
VLVLLGKGTPISFLTGAAASVAAPIALGGKSPEFLLVVLVAVVGAITALLMTGALVAVWLILRVPSWQRDEAQRIIDEFSKQPESARQADARLLARFLELLPSNGDCIFMLRNQDFMGRWFREDLRPLQSFATEWNNAEHEFIDPELEQKRNSLLEAVDRFLFLYGTQTFPVRDDPARSEVSQELEKADFGRYHQVVTRLNDAAEEIFLLHQDLVREARAAVGDSTH